MSPEKQRIAIGRDCCGKEIIPLLGKKLEVRTNRHTTTDGYLWGWIEGTTANTVWGDDHKFNHAAAVTLVRDYNAESSAKHEVNTTKSASSTSPATEEFSVAATIGNEADFVTKTMTADEIMAGKMAKDRVESDRWYAMFSAPLPLTTPEPELNLATEESSATDHFRDATKMASGESSSPTPNPHNQ